MLQIRNFDDANAILSKYIPQVKEILGKDITLSRMTPLMESLGNPQDKLKIIHVAGTSGKTSTAYYIASLLKHAGKRVGLTVSPHIDSVTERVQIDLNPISETEFCAELTEFMKIIEDIKPEPTYFEILMAFAYWYFAKIGVDYAVIETGLGGLHDASNVAERTDKICVITDIGHDHMHVLGKTLPEIAGQKAGIIHTSNQIFMYSQSPEINSVFEHVANKQNAILNMLSENEEQGGAVGLGNLPSYQKRNWLLARRVYLYMQKRDSLPELSEEICSKSINTQIPGRMERFKILGKTLVMDGAHNDQKMQAFAASFQELYPSKKAAIVLALKEGKEYKTVLPHLLPISSSLIITSFDILQDVPSKSIKPAVLASYAKNYGFMDVQAVDDPVEAYNKLLNAAEDILVITGSFYLLSSVRPYIIKHNG